LIVTSPRASAERGGTVTIAVDHAAAVTRELVAREILVDYRPGAGIRISPHFYTTDEELEIAVGEIQKILETKSYQRHEAASAAF
jgi:kynureninase